MFVVVVGAVERREEGDEELMVTILEDLRKKYPSLVVISAACDKGIGNVIKTHCLEEKMRFRFMEVYTRIFAELPKTKLAQVFIARNANLEELGDEFHIFATRDRRGSVEDLIQRVSAKGDRPVYVYVPGEGLKPAVVYGPQL